MREIIQAHEPHVALAFLAYSSHEAFGPAPEPGDPAMIRCGGFYRDDVDGAIQRQMA
jgi:hypothetical protein